MKVQYRSGNALAVVMFSLAFLGQAFAQETAAEIKALIRKDIYEKQIRLDAETKKLKSLYKKNKELDPVGRLEKVEEGAAEFVTGGTKKILEEVGRGGDKSPSGIFKSYWRTKEMVDDFLEKVNEPMQQGLDELDQQTDLYGVVSRQEKIVKEAKFDLGLAQGAASAVFPLLDAVDAARIEAIRREKATAYEKGKRGAEKQLKQARERGSLPPGPAAFPPEVGGIGQGVDRPTKGGSTTKPASEPNSAPPPPNKKRTKSNPPPVIMPDRR